MDQRLEFALRAQRYENFRAFCREYGISARVGYKWKQRLLEEGALSLAEKSRRPRRSPTGLSESERCQLVALRHRHLHWGARKLADLYRRAHGTAPSESTIKRALDRCGLTRKRRQRRASLGGQLGGHPVAAACHDIWTVDFKGWWHDAEGRCEPLTVRDEYPRYVLEARSLAKAKTETVQACFEALFVQHGLPAAIRSDNGVPFASRHGPATTAIMKAGILTSATKSKEPTLPNGKPRWISGAKNLSRSGRTSCWACNDRPMFIVPVRDLGKERPSRSTTRV